VSPLYNGWSPRLLVTATWVLLFALVLVAPSWLATASLIGALVWIAARVGLRLLQHPPGQ
jgi:hypothetical protein